MQKKLAILLLIAVTLTVLTISPLAQAQTTLVYSQASGAANFGPTGGANKYVGITILNTSLSNTGYLESITVYLKRIGTTTGTISAVLYVLEDGAAKPANLESPLETSVSSYSLASLTTDFAAYTFTFAGTNVLSKTGTSYYGIALHLQQSTGTTAFQSATTDTLGFFSDDAGATFTLNSGTANKDIQLYVYATVYTGGTTPPPTDIWNGGWATNVVGVILPLALILIPAFLGWKFAKAWGFFAGVNVGVILCYVYGQLVPLWGVVVMLIVDGLMLFGKLGIRD